jgi:hypothetical protein
MAHPLQKHRKRKEKATPEKIKVKIAAVREWESTARQSQSRDR